MACHSPTPSIGSDGGGCVGQPILAVDAPSVYGSSKFLSPTPAEPAAGFVAAAQFYEYDFAPSPCVCCACLVPEVQKKRMYVHI